MRSYRDRWSIARCISVGESQGSLSVVQSFVMLIRSGLVPIPVSVFGVPPSKETIEGYAEMGVSRCLFGLRPETGDKALPALQRYAEVIKSCG